jgi:hypothetical protein
VKAYQCRNCLSEMELARRPKFCPLCSYADPGFAAIPMGPAMSKIADPARAIGG